MNSASFYFDVLPVHPQPEPLESFTSYLMRLAQANRIKYPCDLGHRLFPEQNPYGIRIITDHVPVTFGVLPQHACCSETRLLATTFYHLGRKFGRPTSGKALSSFLNGAIALPLRYCPLCLQEQLYYRLPWRFLSLIGCHQHGCRLLDCCGACHQPIRLLHHILQVGVCSACRTPLHTSAIEPLSAQEQQQSAQVEQDLTYLLSPQPWETGNVEASISVGRLLERLRWQRGLEPADLAPQIGLTPIGVRLLERGKTSNAGVSFQRYLRYAAYMGVSLQQLFRNKLAAFQPLPDSRPTRKIALVANLQTATELLQVNGQPVNDATLCQTTGSSKHALRAHPATKARPAQVRERAARQRDARQRDEALLKRVKRIVKQLQNKGKPVYLVDISRALKKRSRDLKAHPLVWDYLQQLSPPLQDRPAPRGTTIFARVQEAIQFFDRNGQSFTHQDIADHMGMAAPHLYRYPLVKQLLQQRTAARCKQEPILMLEQVQTALAHLKANDQPITRQAISALTGISYKRLTKYPHIDALITRHLQAAKQREKEERMNQVRQAIRYLKQNGLPITQKAICQTAGLGEGAPHHHLELVEIIQPVMAEEKQCREQQVIEQVAQELQYLLAHNQLITLTSVGQRVGLSEQQLQRRPQVTALVRMAKAEMRERFEDNLIQRIHTAVQALQTADLPLTQNSICAEIDLPRMSLARYQRAKAVVDQIAVPYHQAQGTIWGARHADSP